MNVGWNVGGDVGGESGFGSFSRVASLLWRSFKEKGGAKKWEKRNRGSAKLDLAFFDPSMSPKWCGKVCCRELWIEL